VGRRKAERTTACARRLLEGSSQTKALSDDGVTALFRHSPINLGFTRMVGDDPQRPGKTQVKLRDFEVPMAGGFYLVEKAADYDEHFESGHEVETWETLPELEDKIRYYLGHEEERLAIAQAGQRRALAEHSWGHRFTTLFRELGIG
jgi:spore maturation protein CgeB